MTGYPQSSPILLGVSLVNHPALGLPPWLWKPPLVNWVVSGEMSAEPLGRIVKGRKSPVLRCHEDVLLHCLELKKQQQYRQTPRYKGRIFPWLLTTRRPATEMEAKRNTAIPLFVWENYGKLHVNNHRFSPNSSLPPPGTTLFLSILHAASFSRPVLVALTFCRRRARCAAAPRMQTYVAANVDAMWFPGPGLVSQSHKHPQAISTRGFRQWISWLFCTPRIKENIWEL